MERRAKLVAGSGRGTALHATDSGTKARRVKISGSEQADLDRRWMARAVELAKDSQKEGNAPIGAVLTLDGALVAEGRNQVLVPCFSPGDHAEVMAARNLPSQLRQKAAEITCYTTAEPCIMCLGLLVVHGVGRIVFGAAEPWMGAGDLLGRLPPLHAEIGRVPEMVGPVAGELCRDLSRKLEERLSFSLEISRGRK